MCYSQIEKVKSAQNMLNIEKNVQKLKLHLPHFSTKPNSLFLANNNNNDNFVQYYLKKCK